MARAESHETIESNVTYAVVTPARDEAEALPRLAESLRRQVQRPDRWVIVENGSTDGTLDVATQLAAEHHWITVLTTEGDRTPVRGAPIVRAFTRGVGALDPHPDVVVLVDADVSMQPDYFARLLRVFTEDPRVGIASGTAVERADNRWRRRYVTGGNVWGATRAYRWNCFLDVSPIEQRHGWDGIDQLKARSRGWETRVLLDLPFLHHRVEGVRDGARSRHWRALGETSYYMGYRSWYLVVRAAFHALREPAALHMVRGYAVSAARRDPQCADPAMRAILHQDQSLARIVRRASEALGRTRARATRAWVP